MKTFLRKNLYHIVLGAIFLVAFLLRSYRLTELPDIIHIDEAGLGCNAWSIAHYGVDRYLNEMPFYAQNFEGGQSPLYTYIVVFLILTIGKGDLSLLLARIPGLISSMIVVIVGTKSIEFVFQNKKITLMGALLLTICPYYIMHGRFALDCNLMLGCSTVALYLLAKFIRTQKLGYLIMCGISFGITLYSYALSYFVLPLFLISITLYMLYTSKITFRRSVLFALCVCITGLPIILFAISMLFRLEPINFLGIVISPTASARMGSVADRNFFANIIQIIQITLTKDIYLFDTVDKYYTMYIISIPFVAVGFFSSGKDFFASLKKRCFHFSSLYWIFYICCLITNGLTRAHSVYRANFHFISLLYFLVSGIYVVYRFVRSYRHIFIGILATCYLLWGISFFRYYFTLYSMAGDYVYTKLYIAPFEEAVTDALNLSSVDDIYIDCAGREEYLFFYFPISPYQLSSERHEDGYGRYHFNVDYETPVEAHNAYIVRRENNEFINKLMNCGIACKKIEYEHYYLFYFE